MRATFHFSAKIFAAVVAVGVASVAAGYPISLNLGVIWEMSVQSR